MTGRKIGQDIFLPFWLIHSSRVFSSRFMSNSSFWNSEQSSRHTPCAVRSSFSDRDVFLCRTGTYSSPIANNAETTVWASGKTKLE
jgi:hypothetical protein